MKLPAHKLIKIRWPGIKLGATSSNKPRLAKDVAEDNAIASSPEPKRVDIARAAAIATESAMELFVSVRRLLSGRGKE